MTNENAVYMTPKEICDELQIEVKKLYRLILSGELKAKKIGREYRVSRVAYNEYLENAEV